jgi:hypothetical protein
MRKLLKRRPIKPAGKGGLLVIMILSSAKHGELVEGVGKRPELVARWRLDAGCAARVFLGGPLVC